MNTIDSLTFRKIPMTDIAKLADSDNTEFDWFDVFYVGTHTSAEGNTDDWTHDKLQELVDTFDPDALQVPLVVGHPKTDSPSWGWTSGVRLKDGVLQVKADNVSVAFARNVANKRYPNRSIRIGKTPEGKLQLVHVGFLGGAAPSLAGMPWQFNQSDSDTITFEFSAADPAAKTTPEDEMPVSDEELKLQIEKAQREARDAAEGEFNKKLKVVEGERDQFKTDSETHKAEADKHKNALNQSNAELAKQQYAARVTANQTLVEAAIAKGVFVPAQCEGMAEFMADLQGEDHTFSFSKDGQETTQKHYDFMKNLLENGVKSPLGNGQKPADFNASGDLGGADDLLAKAKTYQKEQADIGVTISIPDAIDKVSGGQ